VVNITQLHTRNTHNDVGACVIYISYLRTRDTQWWAYVGACVGWEGGKYYSTTPTQHTSDVGACVIYITYLHTYNVQWWAYVGACVVSEVRGKKGAKSVAAMVRVCVCELWYVCV